MLFLASFVRARLESKYSFDCVIKLSIINNFCAFNRQLFLGSHILFFVGSSSREGIAEHEKLMENSLQKLKHGSLRNSLENVALTLPL